jgi:hypothetical protein
MIGLGFVIALAPVATLLALGLVAWKLLAATTRIPRAPLRVPRQRRLPAGTPGARPGDRDRELRARQLSAT